MPSDRADRRRLAGRPRWWAAGLVLSLLAALVLLLTVDGGRKADLPARHPASGPSASAPGARADAAARLLERLARALRDGTRADAVALAAPGDARAAHELATLRRNVQTLRITGLSMRYVDEEDTALTEAQRRGRGERAWAGDVQLTWRLGGFDRAVSRAEVALTFAATPRGAAFLSARDDLGGPVPLWLLEPVRAVRTARSLVVAPSRSRAVPFSRLADRAVADVRRVLPRWRGRLVVEVPGDEAELGRVLGSEPGEYGGIAAVTTTVDGSASPRSPVHIFVNPRVFDPLGPQGSQIVMSHEATHVATGAAVASMPSWLLEGFADYVALDGVDLPVTVTASQILARVRRDGPPVRLPGAHEFDPRNKALGASYESAWLACRLLAEKYGQRRLIAFYREADRTGTTTRAFRTLLGTDQADFTRSWRAYLRGLAGPA